MLINITKNGFNIKKTFITFAISIQKEAININSNINFKRTL